jgi:hypothetical protein
LFERGAGQGFRFSIPKHEVILKSRLTRVQELIPVVLSAHTAKARECRALQTLRDIGRASLPREAFGVRRIPPLLPPVVVSQC